VTSLLFLVLLWPTFFMGLSLPLLARALTESAERAADRVGGLYAWNTLGAAAGAVLTFVLVRRWGFDGAVHFAAALNLACAVLALATAARRPRGEGGAGDAPPPDRGGPTAPPVEAPPRLATWLGVYALSGFVALSLEIVWFRVLGSCPTPRVRDTFLSVFPHVLAVGDTLLGSDQPIPFDPDVLRRRLADPAIRAYFSRAGVDIASLIERELAEKEVRVFGPGHERSGTGDLNTDLFPRDEYLSSERFWPSAAHPGAATPSR
jgi:hypothetical protein